MLAGLAGHLLSTSFLEGRLAAAGAMNAHAWRRFVEARRLGDTLGPSSSLRALLEVGASPLDRVLGFEPPRDVERADTVLVTTLTGGAEGVALIVAPWSEPLDRLRPPATMRSVTRRAASATPSAWYEASGSMRGRPPGGASVMLASGPAA